MSAQKLKAEESDDEFQDALDATASGCDDDVTKSNNKEIVDEIIGMQKNLQINEAEEIESNCDEPEDAAESTTKPEYIDDEIDEVAKKAQEDILSVEELLQRKETAAKLKLDGNELFKNNEAEKSIEIYTEALKLCPLMYTKDRAILYGNRAAAKVLIDSKKSAIQDCSKAIELYPEYVRAILRRAKLYEQNEEHLEDALNDFKRVNELDPGQHEARAALLRLPPLINERNEKLKEQMMGQLKGIGNMILKPFGLSTDNFKMQQDPNTGSYSINFSQNNPR